MSTPEFAPFLPRILVALALGSLVGLERQWHRRLVDLKTNALVSMGAALFMSASADASGFVEPIRMAGQIVVGVGFIGGGLLFRDGAQMRGINTAATLWCCAALGTLCGLGRLLEASCAAVLLVLANSVLRKVARQLNLRMGLSDSLTEQLCFDFECQPAQSAAVREKLEAVLLARRAELRALSETRNERGYVVLSAVAAFETPDIRHEIDTLLRTAEGWGLQSVSWRRL
ncbi:MgtC/SapB family protein [Aquabacterium sp.]|uniref:MgtC/SapB family protein n=1 Tax=Aquabacterium sp. TaxID=1872578 RepID=UPI003782E1F0